MHQKFFLLFAIFFIGNYVQCQTQRPAIVWQKWYGGSGVDIANDVLLTADGGMIVVGTTGSNDGDVTGNHGGNDGWVIKLDASGNKQWQRCVGGSAEDKLTTITKCTGGYLCVGYTKSNDGDISNLHTQPAYYGDCWVVKLSDSGIVLWSKAFGGSSEDYAKSCIETSDGNYVIVGNSYSVDGDVHSDPTNNSVAWVFKLNPAGDIIWENSLLTSTTPVYGLGDCYDVVETYDHQLLAYASTYRYFDSTLYTPVAFEEGIWYYDTTVYTNLYDGIGLIYKLGMNDGNPDLVFQTEGDNSFSMKQLPDGIYISYFNNRYRLREEGDAHSGLCSDEESLVAKLDNSTGNFTSMRTYLELCEFAGSTVHSRFFPSSPHGADKIENGLWLQAGYQFSMSSCGGDVGSAHLIIPGKDGYNYGGGADDGFNSVKILPNGYEFICAGYTRSVDGDLLGHGPVEWECNGIPDDFWILKLSASTNEITGNIFLDENNNNIKDENEHVFTKGMVNITKPGFDISYSINGGHYKAEVDTGSFVTHLVLNNPVYYSALPVSDVSVFGSHFGADTVDFAVHKNGDFTDNTVSIFSTDNVRPGRMTGYTIRLANNGTAPAIDRKLTIIKDSRLQYSSASITPLSISGDTITWNIDTLPVDALKFLNVSLLPGIPPVLDAGDTVYSSILFDSTADLNIADNYASVKQLVINSFDPNDKTEVHAGSISKLEVQQGNYLTYTIRFQNTGNDTAFNITIRDALDEKLSTGTFEMIATSHPYQLKIKDGKYLSWEFNDVMLVDSNHNEPASHGFVTYRIKSKSDLVLGDVINNAASIYFDFNQPVVTNTERTTVVKTIAIWTGAQSSAWDNKVNWNINAVPDAETVVIIPANVPNYPVVNSNASCFTLRVDSNATITVSEGVNLEITGK